MTEEEYALRRAMYRHSLLSYALAVRLAVRGDIDAIIRAVERREEMEADKVLEYRQAIEILASALKTYVKPSVQTREPGVLKT